MEETKDSQNGTAPVESKQLSAVESPAQPLNNSIIDPDAVSRLIQELKQGKIINIIEAENSGLLVARVEGVNRDVNKKHVQELVENVKKINHFLQPIMVLDAISYFDFYPDRKLLVNGITIDKNNPECYRIVVNLDGQHRYETEKELLKEGYKTATLKAEYIDLCGLAPDQWMTSINTLQRNWTSKDRTSHILSITDDPETNIFVANEWQKKYGMGDRAAHAVLRLDDTYKKSWQVDYMNKPSSDLPPELKGTPKQRERGAKILHAFEVGFRSQPRMLKNMAAINLAIEKYSLADDTEKEDIVKKIILFFTSLDKDVANKAAAESSVVAKKNVLTEEWNRISKQFNSEPSLKALEEQAAEAESEWQSSQKTTKSISNKATKTSNEFPKS